MHDLYEDWHDPLLISQLFHSQRDLTYWTTFISMFTNKH